MVLIWYKKLIRKTKDRFCTDKDLLDNIKTDPEFVYSLIM